MKISEKIKKVLSEADYKEFESGLTAMVETKVTELVTEAVTLKETEIKKKYEIASEKFIEAKVKELYEAKEVELIAESEKKLELLEDKLSSKLGSFLEQVISESISEETFEKIAINEAILPAFNQIKTILAEANISITPDTTKAITESEDKLAKTEKLLAEAYAKNEAQEKRLEQACVSLLVESSTAGFTNDQKAKVMDQFMGKDFQTVEKEIGSFVQLIREADELSFRVDLITESIKPKETVEKPAAILEAEQGLPEKKIIVEKVEDEKKEPSILETASYFMPDEVE